MAIELRCRGQRGKRAWYRDRFGLDASSWDVLARDSENVDVLLSRSKGAESAVVACAVPLDWNRSPVLASLIALAVRGRGCLFLRPDEGRTTEIADRETVEPYLQRLGENGYFVHEQRLDSALLADPACRLDRCSLSPFFATVVLSTAWELQDLQWMSSTEIVERLERHESLAACVAAPSRRKILVEIAEPPAYARRARHFAEWLHLALVSRAGTLTAFELRAVVRAASAIHQAYADKTAVPSGIAPWQIARILTPEVTRLIRDGHVETDPLRTCAALSAVDGLLALKVDDPGGQLAAAAGAMRKWLTSDENAPWRRASAYELVQSLAWNATLWETRLGRAFVETNPEWWARTDLAGRPYTLILALEHRGGDPRRTLARLAEIATSSATPAAARAEAVLAVLGRAHESTARTVEAEAARGRVAGAVPWLRAALHDLEKQERLEAVSMATAALIGLEGRQGLTIAESTRARVEAAADLGPTGGSEAVMAVNAKNAELHSQLQRAQAELAELTERNAQREDELKAEYDGLNKRFKVLSVSHAVFAVATWILFVVLAAVFLGLPALLGALFGLPGLYGAVVTLGPKIVPGLSALPLASSAPDRRGAARTGTSTST